jgi:hypothetical protein
MLRKLKLLVIVTILSNNLYAQTNNNQIEFTAVEGLKIFTPRKYVLQGKIWGGELAYHFNMADNKLDYIKTLNISAIDIVASYRNIESITINNDPASKGSLGDAYSVIGRLEMPLVRAGPVKLLFTPGFGFAYSTVSYFSDKNPLVGSRLNVAAQAGLQILTAITPSTGLHAGIDLFHYSNIGIRIPNNGINSLNISFGITQGINQKGPSTPTNPYTYGYKSSFELGGDVGVRGLYISKQELPRSGLYAGYSYRLSQVFSLKGGVDAGFYYELYNPQNHNIIYDEGYASSYDKWRLGLSLGGDINLGRLTVMGAYGYYLHFHGNYPTKTYWTPGLKYYVLPWLAIQGKTYIHSNQADYLGLGLLFRVHL